MDALGLATALSGATFSANNGYTLSSTLATSATQSSTVMETVYLSPNYERPILALIGWFGGINQATESKTAATTQAQSLFTSALKETAVFCAPWSYYTSSSAGNVSDSKTNYSIQFNYTPGESTNFSITMCSTLSSTAKYARAIIFLLYIIF